MKIVIILIQVFFLSVNLIAQTPTISFQKSFGGTLYEDGIDVISLPNGDFVVCGSSFSDISGDKSTNSYGGADYWIVKINPTGSIVWQTTIGGTKDDIPAGIVQTLDGGFLISGSSRSPSSGNKSANNYGAEDVWVVKLSASGQLEWDKSFGGTSYDFGKSIISLANGNYLLANTSGSGRNGNKTVLSKGQSDYWCVIIDNNGSIINQFSFGGSLIDNLTGAELLYSNHVLLTGNSNSGISGDKVDASLGNHDFWLIVSDLNGNIISSTTIGGSEYDLPLNSVTGVDKVTRVFGVSDSNPSGNKSAVNYGYNDYWVVTIDSNLNKINDNSFGGDRNEGAFPGKMGVYFSATDEYVIAGSSNSGVSGNKLTPSFNQLSDDFWVMGLDINGGKTFEFVAGGTEGDQPRSIIETENNTICIVGTSTSGSSGNKTDTTRGFSDIWLLELDFNLSVETIVDNNQLKAYPNPTNAILNFSLPMIVNNSEVSLRDVTGKVMYSKQLEMVNEHQIDITSLPKGLYVLSVISKEFQYTRKVIIE